MNIYCKTCFTSLIIALLFGLSMPQLASAKSSTALGSRNNVPQDEINADTTTTTTITSYSSIAGYTAYNWYGASTTPDNIYSAAFGVGDVYSISFYIGHGGWDTWWHFWGWPWQWHTHTQYCITADDGTHVYDCDIYTHTSCGNVKFEYLWSCEQGNEIGSMITYPCGEVRARGMPLSWLHTSSLSSDGYASPDGGVKLFNGFEGAAPFLTYDGLGATDAGYYFLQYFYSASLYYGYYYSVNAALDYAAQIVWGTSFANCILRNGYSIGGSSGRMRVYGNGNIHISDHTGGGGGGCPLLYGFDGSDYAYEGLLDIHDPSGRDVVTRHTLTTTLEPVHNAYLLRLVEHPLTHSYIDQVKLFATTVDGATIQLPLVSAFHDEYGNVLPQLLLSDDAKAEAPANHIIDLKFRALPQNIEVVAFVFQIEGNNPYYKR